jgi:hypothetical protein
LDLSATTQQRQLSAALSLLKISPLPTKGHPLHSTHSQLLYLSLKNISSTPYRGSSSLLVPWPAAQCSASLHTRELYTAVGGPHTFLPITWPQKTAAVLAPCTVCARPAHAGPRRASHRCSPLPSCLPRVLTASRRWCSPLRWCTDKLDAPPLTSAPSSSSIMTNSIDPNRGDIVLKTHVPSICFRDILQVFQMDVAKVDRDVAYVAIVVQVCRKGLFPMFHMCFWMYVASVLSRYCICFPMATHVFFRVCIRSDVCCKCFNCFRRMLQAFHLSVAKVDLVLHML